MWDHGVREGRTIERLSMLSRDTREIKRQVVKLDKRLTVIETHVSSVKVWATRGLGWVVFAAAVLGMNLTLSPEKVAKVIVTALSSATGH